MNVDLFSDHYFKFLSVKTDITKRESNEYIHMGQKLLKPKYLLQD